MAARFFTMVTLAALLLASATAKDKKKSSLPEDILRARTVLVVIDPEAGEPIDQPNANATARDNVERALMEWGRFSLVMDGQESDLIIVVRTGGGAMRPTMKGGPIDQRPGLGQTTDSSVRIGGQRGQPPPLSDPTMDPRSQRPHLQNEMGPSDVCGLSRQQDRSAGFASGLALHLQELPARAPSLGRGGVSQNPRTGGEATAVEKALSCWGVKEPFRG